MESTSQKWADAYAKLALDGRDLAVPTETLVRLFKGSYISGMPTSFNGMTALDVGCGNGNNSLFLAQLGLQVSATEIDEAICEIARLRAQSCGLTLDARVGHNLKLPFEDQAFDFLVSWNVLHYENSAGNIVSALDEYRRVLKDGGRFILSTTGPDHKILEGARTVGCHLYEICRPDDFRRGERFFYFDAENYIRYYFERTFANVEIGRVHDRLFAETLDWWIVTGTRSHDGGA